VQKRKRPRLRLELWDAKLNSPPPKSAHNHPTDCPAILEWLGRATQNGKGMREHWKTTVNVL